MGLKGALTDREYDKFTTSSDGETAVRVDIGTVELTTSDIQIGAVEIKDATSSNRLIVDSNGSAQVFDPVANSLVPEEFDFIGMLYSGSNLTQATYKSGGSAGSTVSTLQMAYDTAGNMTSVTKV